MSSSVYLLSYDPADFCWPSALLEAEFGTLELIGGLPETYFRAPELSVNLSD